VQVFVFQGSFRYPTFCFYYHHKSSGDNIFLDEFHRRRQARFLPDKLRLRHYIYRLQAELLPEIGSHFQGSDLKFHIQSWLLFLPENEVNRFFYRKNQLTLPAVKVPDMSVSL